MRIIGAIEDPSVIRDILTHLGLWLARVHISLIVNTQIAPS